MDPHGHIYEDDEGEIPPEDKARLHGFLIARAEQDAEKAAQERVSELEAELEKARKDA